jgi:hypothetical protein
MTSADSLVYFEQVKLVLTHTSTLAAGFTLSEIWGKRDGPTAFDMAKAAVFTVEVWSQRSCAVLRGVLSLSPPCKDDPTPSLTGKSFREAFQTPYYHNPTDNDTWLVVRLMEIQQIACLHAVRILAAMEAEVKMCISH